MRRTEARAGQMVRWNPKTDGRYVQTATFDLSKEAEGRIGRIYGLMAADAPTRTGEALFAHLEDALGRGVLEAMRRCPADAPKEEVFETAVACVNRAVARLLGEKGIGLDPEFVTAALVAMQGETMSAAVWGRPSLLLYRRTPSGGSQAFDLIGDDPFASARRCFGSVISGPLASSDRILVSSDDPRSVINELKLSVMMTAPDPGTSAARIREELAGTEGGPSLALLALDVAPVRYLEDGGSRTVSTETSIADLQRMESRTGEIMSPSAMAALQKSFVDTASAAGGKLSSLGKKAAADHRATATSPEHAKHPNVRKFAIGAFLKRALVATTTFVFSIGKSALRMLKMLASGEHKRIPELARAKADAAANRAVDLLNALSGQRRALLLVGLSAVFALNASVLALTWKDRLVEFAAAGERRVSEISHQIDSADASLLYRDETRARAILSDAETAIAALPARSEADRAAKSALQDRIAKSRDSMRHAVKLGAPAEISAQDAAVADLAKLAADKAAAAGTAGSAIADSAIWNGRVYELIPAENRIVRHVAGSPAGTAPQFYLKDATDVSRGVSMTIDGDVWVLSSDGTITRLLRGTRVAFDVGAVEPALTDAKRLRTSPESKYLHVLADGRIVRFDKKTGGLVTQFESEDLHGASDFTLSADGKTAIVAVNGSFLRFSLPE